MSFFVGELVENGPFSSFSGAWLAGIFLTSSMYYFLKATRLGGYRNYLALTFFNIAITSIIIARSPYVEEWACNSVVIICYILAFSIIFFPHTLVLLYGVFYVKVNLISGILSRFERFFWPVLLGGYFYSAFAIRVFMNIDS